MRALTRVRRPLGISAGIWFVAHSIVAVLELFDFEQSVPAQLVAPGILLGVLATLVFVALLATSNARAQAGLGRRLKRLHRLVWFAVPLALVHTVLSSLRSVDHVQPPGTALLGGLRSSPWSSSSSCAGVATGAARRTSAGGGRDRDGALDRARVGGPSSHAAGDTGAVEASARAARVLARIRATPVGFVRTYGDVSPGAARFAGAVLAGCADPTLPWHRIVRADGSLAKGERQRALLEAEGIPFRGERVEMRAARLPES